MRKYCGMVLVGSLLLGGTACRPTDACAETGTPCGGDPVGAWAEADICQDPTLQDSIGGKQTYRNQSMVPGGQSPPEATSTDWCSSLEFFGPDGIRIFALPRDTPRIRGAYLNYREGGADHTQGVYATLVTSSDRTSINYSASCLQRFGYSPGSCSQFGEAFAAYGASLGGVQQTHCEDSGQGGCLCSYLSESDAAGPNLSGSWRKNGHVITHFASNMVLPSQVDYCVQGDQMTLWGHNRTNILDFAGLRILVLRRIVCGDGYVDRGEDCDPPDAGKMCSQTCHVINPP
jgi:hypothetical protein